MIIHYIVVPAGQKEEKLDFYRVAINYEAGVEKPRELLNAWLKSTREIGVFSVVHVIRTRKNLAPFPHVFCFGENIFVYPIEKGVGRNE